MMDFLRTKTSFGGFTFCLVFVDDWHGCFVCWCLSVATFSFFHFLFFLCPWFLPPCLLGLDKTIYCTSRGSLCVNQICNYLDKFKKGQIILSTYSASYRKEPKIFLALSLSNEFFWFYHEWHEALHDFVSRIENPYCVFRSKPTYFDLIQKNPWCASTWQLNSWKISWCNNQLSLPILFHLYFYIIHSKKASLPYHHDFDLD